MTEQIPNPTDPASPLIAVDQNIAAKDQTGAAVRDIMLVASALPLLVAAFGAHGVVGAVQEIGSSEFAPALGVLMAVGVVAWRQIRTRLHAKMFLAAARSPANETIYVKGEQPKP